MKICQINCVYGTGSTGKIVRDLHSTLIKEGYESVVIVSRKSQFTDEDGVKVTSNIFLSYCSALLRRGLGMSFDWAIIQTIRIIRILKRENPDIVHLHCVNGNDINLYSLYKYLAKNRVKTLYTLHAEFPYTGGCGNSLNCDRWRTGCGNCPNLKAGLQSPWIDGTHRTWKKQLYYYRMFDKQLLRFTAVSPWLLQRSEDSPLLKGFRKTTVLNGVDTNVFCSKSSTSEWRKKLGFQKNEKLLLYVTASFYPHQDNLKGGRYVLEVAEKLRNIPIKIVVAANYGDDCNLPENVLYVGRTTTQTHLADLYKEADLTLITSINETFGMPVAESLCCGTPVIGFKAGGPESISIPDYCEFVEFADTEALCDSIIKWIGCDKNGDIISSLAVRKYSKEEMTNNYIKQYKSFFKCI